MSNREDTHTPEPGEITRLLDRWSAGEEGSIEPLLDLVYEELRLLAGRYMRRERKDHTLAPTALVHEAYLRLMKSKLDEADLQNRQHFFAVAAQAMRRILVEHARRHQTARRGADQDKVSLDPVALDQMPSAQTSSEEVLAVDQALDELRKLSPRQAQVVEMRYFVGLGEDDIAATLGVSRATVTRDWRVARMMLSRSLSPGPEDGGDGGDKQA